ncbi:MAG: PH domain-containing protein [Clostridia bacterium]
MKFKSKIGWIFITSLVIVIITAILPIIILKDHVKGLICLIVMLPVISFMLWMLLGTSYTILDKYVICRNGPFRETLELNNISSIENCINSRSSLAMSSNRIKILQYGSASPIYISPKNKEVFLQMIKSKCHNLYKQN